MPQKRSEHGQTTEWSGSKRNEALSKCSYCHQRKGKRSCPAMDGFICTTCCGTHRLSAINCPSTCSYLEPNDEYQQKRIGERFETERRAFYRELLEFGGERATEVFYVFEALAYRFFQDRRTAQDVEVLTGIQTLRNGYSLIHVPETTSPPFGEELKKEFKVFEERQTLDPVLVIEVLDRAQRFIQTFSGSSIGSHRFLQGLIGYIRERHPDVAEQLARQTGAGGRIVIPSGFQYEPASSIS